MKKLSLRLLSLFALGMFVTVGTASVTPAFAQGWFGTVTDTAWIGIAGTGTAQGGKLITIIKSFINWMLGILSLIALVILLYGGFSMVTAAGDDGKYKKGFKILQQAAVGLIFIGVSWMMVSVIFYLLTLVGVS